LDCTWSFVPEASTSGEFGSEVNCAAALTHTMHIAKVLAKALVLTLNEFMGIVCHTRSPPDPGICKELLTRE
jgi:hypothetical protein